MPISSHNTCRCLSALCTYSIEAIQMHPIKYRNSMHMHIYTICTDLDLHCDKRVTFVHMRMYSTAHE